VFCLYKVTSVQEALEYANFSKFGHGATVFSESPNYCKQMTLRLRVGLVHLNHAPYITSEFPSGGIKDSGFGSSSYHDGLTNLANRKSIVNKTW
jgi:succinate-semialdehyde dehydrogenase/glutarate-semialdehyde dehydrogenase